MNALKLGYTIRRCGAILVGLISGLSAMSHAAETWNYDDLGMYVDGATIMAAGGGGSAKVAKQLLSTYFGPSDTVILNDVSDIQPDKGYSAASVGAIGSPASLFNLPDPLGLPLNTYFAMYLMYNHYERPINYLMPIEVGAINGLYAFLTANKLNQLNPADGVSVLNVDGGGRSVPTLPLLIYSYFPNTYGQEAFVSSPDSSRVDPMPSPTPWPFPPSIAPSEWAMLTAAGGDQERIEATILAMISDANSPYSGAAGYGSFYAFADNIVGSPPVTGQQKVAHQAGVAYQATPSGISVVASLSNSGRVAKAIFSGTVTNITLDTQGLDYGVVTVTGSGAYQGDVFTIQYENENICAYKHSYSTTTPYVLGPDTVAYVPTDGVVFDNSDLYNLFKGGQTPAVDIVAIQASPQITQISGIMEAWGDVRAAIPNGQCDFAYSSPWIENRSSVSKILTAIN